MPLVTMIIPILASTAQASGTPITVTGYTWAPFISPMGEPFRSRSPDDDPFARWFHQADLSGDGTITADEMRADAERFFAILDINQDDEIDSEEIVAYEQEIAPEIQVNSRWRLSRQETAAAARSAKDGDARVRERRRADRYIDGYQIDGLQGAARYGLLNLPQPVVGADADFNRRITPDEFRRAASYRFQLLDSRGEGRLSFADLEALVPSRPKQGRPVKPRKDAVDERIGLPLPKGN